MESENNVDTSTTKTEEQIRDEVKQEIEREEEIRQEVKDEYEKKDNAKRNARKVVRIIWSICMVLVFLFVVFEIAMGILNMQRMNEEKDPLWYFTTDVKKEDSKKITSYNMGLYDIVKTEDLTGTRVMLRPFFISE